MRDWFDRETDERTFEVALFDLGAGPFVARVVDAGTAFFATGVAAFLAAGAAAFLAGAFLARARGGTGAAVLAA